MYDERVALIGLHASRVQLTRTKCIDWKDQNVTNLIWLGEASDLVPYNVVLPTSELRKTFEHGF